MNLRFWLRFVALAAAVVLIGSWSVSRALENGWARRSLLARLGASFGRPVEVGHFGFSLLSGPKLEADSVSVAEDPRFGQEYFLRAEQLTAVLRWTALLRGRIEFGSLALSRPSLNLVRNPGGHWNIESWLPPVPKVSEPASAPAGAASPVKPAAAASLLGRRLDHIAVDDGRINFKLENDKLPFALVGVTGQLEQDSAGRWNLDLTADPMRTSVAVQEAGSLRLRGMVAGTSAALRPADLTLTWDQGSLADALRLATGRDYGVRGVADGQFSIKIADVNPRRAESPPYDPALSATWTIAGALHLQGVHRWDLTERPTDPAITTNFVVAWQPGHAKVELTHYDVESPRSRLDAVGSLDWSSGFHPTVQVVSSHIAFDDVLAWHRAFQPAMADDLSMEGNAAVEATVVDWPPRIEQADISSQGAAVRVASLGEIRFGRMEAKLDHGSLLLPPVQVSLPSAPVVVRNSRSNSAPAIAAVSGGNLRVDGALGPLRPGKWPSDWEYHLTVSGDTQRTEDLMAAAFAFGRRANPDWSVAGPAAFHLTWKGALRHGTSSAAGTVELHGLRLTTVLMNRTVVASASVDIRPGEQRVNIASAQAFDTNWKGSLERRSANDEWNFDLSADRLDVAQLDLWLGPRARPGMFARMLPFTAAPSSSPPRDAALGSLQARGRLRVADVTLAPIHLQKVDAAAEIHGRDLLVRSAQAGFYDGRISGDFEARLQADPRYTIHAQIERANLAALVATSNALSGQAGGLASGVVHLDAHGIGRQDLLASLAGDGNVRIRDVMLSGPKLRLPLHAPDAPPETASSEEGRAPGERHFGLGAATFHVGGGLVRVDQLSLVGREEQFQVDGSVDFAARMNLRVLSTPRGADPSADSEASASGGEWTLGGTLTVPQWSRVTNTAGDRTTTPRVHR